MEKIWNLAVVLAIRIISCRCASRSGGVAVRALEFLCSSNYFFFIVWLGFVEKL